MPIMPSGLVVKGGGQNGFKTGFSSCRRVTRGKFSQIFGTLLNQRPREVSVAERSVRDLRHVPRYHVPLQYDHQEERMQEERRQSSQLSASLSTISEGDECTEALGKSSRKRRVTFEESVVVVPVPLRCDYSERMLTKLWSNAVERCDNVGEWMSNWNTQFRFTPSSSNHVLFLSPQSGTRSSLRPKTATGAVPASKMKCTPAVTPTS